MPCSSPLLADHALHTTGVTPAVVLHFTPSSCSYLCSYRQLCRHRFPDRFYISEYNRSYQWQSVSRYCLVPRMLIFKTLYRTYVTEETAVALNLTYASGDTLIMRADDTTILDPDGPGRNSVRIMSVNNYTTHVAVYVHVLSIDRMFDKLNLRLRFDIRHMPEGCSTWPAAWETGATNWPDCGEVDIVSPKFHVPGSRALTPARTLITLSVKSSKCHRLRKHDLRLICFIPGSKA